MSATEYLAKLFAWIPAIVVTLVLVFYVGSFLKEMWDVFRE